MSRLCFYALFFLRRFVFHLDLVFASHYPQFQVYFSLALSLLLLAYLSFFRPFSSWTSFIHPNLIGLQTSLAANLTTEVAPPVSVRVFAVPVRRLHHSSGLEFGAECESGSKRVCAAFPILPGQAAASPLANQGTACPHDQ